MLNTISKLLETLIRNRLVKEIEVRGGLHSHQYGFRKGKSTIHALEGTLKIIGDCDCKWCVLVTIDVKNAFNTASHSLIIKELRAKRISSYLIKLISSYLRNRKVMADRDMSMNVGSGVPQGSVLGPTLWNVLYDGVLDLDLVVNAATIAFADDLALIVGANSEDTLMKNVNECLIQIGTWMEDHHLTLAPEKTEAVLVRGGRRRNHVAFTLNGTAVTLKKTVRYLGVTFDSRGNFGSHITQTAEKGQKKLAGLIRLMPNIGGPSSCKRAVLCASVHNIILYGAPIWSGALETKRYRDILCRVQRHMLLRVASAFRTVSGEALQVITGVVPVDLQARERKRVHECCTIKERNTATTTTLEMWQSRWDNNNSNGQWTKRLIPDIWRWHGCKFRRTDYFLTQALSGHGVFRAYAKRFNKDSADHCIYCGEIDTAEHTIFHCSRWNSLRTGATVETGLEIGVDNLVTVMISSESNWNIIHRMIAGIMKTKETEERARQATTPQN